MDIHLQTSRYLFVFRLAVFILAALAIALAHIPIFYSLALIFLLSCQCLWTTRKQTAVRRLQIIETWYPEEEESRQQIILELVNSAIMPRRIEVRLERFYCLWWVQLLYFRSSAGSVNVLVLPDSCSPDEQRQIRKYLQAAV